MIKIEHKLKGLEELTKMRRKVAIASGKEEAKENSSEEKEEIQVFWLTYEYFISWVLQNEILELIFIDSSSSRANSEIFSNCQHACQR